MSGKVPKCTKKVAGVNCGGVMKPDIVMFGEPLPQVRDTYYIQCILEIMRYRIPHIFYFSKWRGGAVVRASDC